VIARQADDMHRCLGNPQLRGDLGCEGCQKDFRDLKLIGLRGLRDVARDDHYALADGGID
jgi:hypothetical protein